MKQFKQQLRELLQIQAPSGKEAKVVKYLQPKLAQLTDKCFTDTYGNLLAEKKFGDAPVTILLSAHMDSVRNIKPDRKVIERDGKFMSTSGVLGADDRAGIAIIMAVLRNIGKTSFQGTVKVAFSREEEIGCVGASKIDKNWYKDVNLAIVVDRRGNRDIVINSGGYQPFCDPAVGDFLVNCGALQGMDDWKPVDGGISDACIFSEAGINSVNLSAGYMNEHTEKEYVVLEDCKSTIQLILQAFALVEQFAPTWGAVPDPIPYASKYDRWDYDYMYGADDAQYFENADFFEDEDAFGNIYGSTVGGFISILQDDPRHGKQEIWLTEKMMDKLVSAWLDFQWARDQVIKTKGKKKKEYAGV